MVDEIMDFSFSICQTVVEDKSDTNSKFEFAIIMFRLNWIAGLGSNVDHRLLPPAPLPTSPRWGEE
jgi:hypothetical protein